MAVAVVLRNTAGDKKMATSATAGSIFCATVPEGADSIMEADARGCLNMLVERASRC
jgi:hypothetical protein